MTSVRDLESLSLLASYDQLFCHLESQNLSLTERATLFGLLNSSLASELNPRPSKDLLWCIPALEEVQLSSLVNRLSSLGSSVARSGVPIPLSNVAMVPRFRKVEELIRSFSRRTTRAEWDVPYVRKERIQEFLRTQDVNPLEVRLLLCSLGGTPVSELLRTTVVNPYSTTNLQISLGINLP